MISIFSCERSGKNLKKSQKKFALEFGTFQTCHSPLKYLWDRSIRALQCLTVLYSALQCLVPYTPYSALQCLTVPYSALQCLAVHPSASQCIPVHPSASQCIPVHPSASHCITLHETPSDLIRLSSTCKNWRSMENVQNSSSEVSRAVPGRSQRGDPEFLGLDPKF